MKKINIIIIVLLFIFVTANNLLNICKSYFPYTFDFQILQTWRYSAVIGQMPYKDIFYPYGFLSYYKGILLPFSYLYLLITPIQLISIWFLLNKISKSNIFSIISLIFFTVFIYLYTGFETFSRYGIAVVMSMVFAYYMFHSVTFLNIKKTILFGIVTVLIFLNYNDQGIYVFALFFALLFIDSIRRFNRNFIKYLELLKIGCLYLFTILVSLYPFIIFTFIHGYTSDFFNSFIQLSHLEALAKLPYFHSFIQIDKVFTLSVLFISVSFLSKHFIFDKKSMQFDTYLLLAVVLSLIVIEQKSIVRAIDDQLTFAGILLLILLSIRIVNNLDIKLISRGYTIVYFSLFFYSLLQFPFHNYTKNFNYSNCLINREIQISSERHQKVVSFLRTNLHNRDAIFSYPGDEIFYILLKQNPPYYPSIFEASSLEAQNALVNYIISNKVRYVLFNAKTKAIQDEVPDIVRVPYLTKYIFNSFTPKYKINEFIIFEKNVFNKDDLLSNFQKFEDLRTILTSVNLGNIPNSEGFYKSQFLAKDGQELIRTTKSNVLESYFQSNTTQSDNIIIKLITTRMNKSDITLAIETIDGFQTNVTFSGCQNNNTCIIHLSNIPLFYKIRYIKNITIHPSSALESIALYKMNNIIRYW